MIDWRKIEVWASIPGYEGIYEVSSFGNVRRIQRASGCTVGKPLKFKWTLDRQRNKRYSKVTLSVKRTTRDFLVHVLVLEAFIGPRPEGYDGDHINGVAHDNNLVNLRWLATPENRAQGADRQKGTAKPNWRTLAKQRGQNYE